MKLVPLRVGFAERVFLHDAASSQPAGGGGAGREDVQPRDVRARAGAVQHDARAQGRGLYKLRIQRDPTHRLKPAWCLVCLTYSLEDVLVNLTRNL